MSELDLVRDLFPERAVDPAARERVRAAVAARTSERRNRVFRRPRLVSAAGGVALAAVAASAIVILFAGTSATVSASAARVLHRAASAALLERSVGALAPGQYLYTRSVDEYLATTGGTRPDGTTWSYSALVPTVREIWLAANGSGWLHETGGAPTFLSDRDRQAWIADGRPNLGTGESSERLGGGGSDAQMTSLDLPSDPDALYARLHHEAEGNGNGVYPEMFTLIGDALRENSTTPAQRAALYEVAARLPGIVLAGRTSDATGRPAIAVAMDNGHNGERWTLLFDPEHLCAARRGAGAAAGQPARIPRRNRRRPRDLPGAARRGLGSATGRGRGEALGFSA